MGIRIGFTRNVARRVIAELSIEEPPISINKIASHYKLELWEYEKFPQKISALIIPGKNIIVVNPQNCAERKRFSIAHELGHLLLDHFSNKNTEENTEDMDFLMETQLKRKYTGEEESEANEFAAELLMPLPIIKKYYPNQIAKPADLAELFKVSEQAMWVHLSRLKLIKY